MKQQIYEYENDEAWIPEFAKMGTVTDPLGKRIPACKCKICDSLQYSITGNYQYAMMKHLINRHDFKFTRNGVQVE